MHSPSDSSFRVGEDGIMHETGNVYVRCPPALLFPEMTGSVSLLARGAVCSEAIFVWWGQAALSESVHESHVSSTDTMVPGRAVPLWYGIAQEKILGRYLTTPRKKIQHVCVCVHAVCLRTSNTEVLISD